jgi:hypothetical protein
LSEVNKRWKSLIVLYHPDRNSSKQLFESRAKKINGIYEQMLRLQEQKLYPRSLNNMIEVSLPRSSKLIHEKYFKYIPHIIIVLAIIIAILSLILFFFNFSVTTTYTSSQHTKRKELKIILTEYNNVSDINS